VREKQMSRSEHLLRKVWRDNFEAQFLRALPGATILGHNQPRLWNTVSALMPEGDRKSQWVIRLDKAGFAVSTGSACTTGKEEPSHVLSAMGFKSARGAFQRRLGDERAGMGRPAQSHRESARRHAA